MGCSAFWSRTLVGSASRGRSAGGSGCGSPPYVFQDGVGKLNAGRPPFSVQQFGPHAAPERLDGGVVEAAADGAQGGQRGHCAQETAQRSRLWAELRVWASIDLFRVSRTRRVEGGSGRRSNGPSRSPSRPVFSGQVVTQIVTQPRHPGAHSARPSCPAKLRHRRSRPGGIRRSRPSTSPPAPDRLHCHAARHRTPPRRNERHRRRRHLRCPRQSRHICRTHQPSRMEPRPLRELAEPHPKPALAASPTSTTAPSSDPTRHGTSKTSSQLRKQRLR